MIQALAEHQILIKQLKARLSVEKTIQTHASTIILTKFKAYKIKKPVNFGFLDYSDFATRKKYYNHELQISKKYNSKIYLNVIPIYQHKSEPRATIAAVKNRSRWRIVEYAIVMKRFNYDKTLDKIGKAVKVDVLFDFIDFIHYKHTKTKAISQKETYGNFLKTKNTIVGNVIQLQQHANKKLPNIAEAINRLIHSQKNKIIARKNNGAIIHCHGDLHLGNVVLIQNKIYAFDPIEFNKDFMYIDSLNDMAFFLMDLCRANTLLARLALSRYLQTSNHYQYLSLLTLYQCYRALVRAKIAVIQNQKKLYEKYISITKSLLYPHRPIMVLLHGISGNGKSHLAKKLLSHMDGVIISTDIIRQKLFKNHTYKYSEKTTKLVYKKMMENTKAVIKSNYSCVLDGTFLTPKIRSPFISYAQKNNIPLAIIKVHAADTVAKKRIAARKRKKNEPSSANWTVRENQKLILNPPTDGNCPQHVKIFNSNKLSSFRMWLAENRPRNSAG